MSYSFIKCQDIISLKQRIGTRGMAIGVAVLVVTATLLLSIALSYSSYNSFQNVNMSSNPGSSTNNTTQFILIKSGSESVNVAISIEAAISATVLFQNGTKLQLNAFGTGSGTFHVHLTRSSSSYVPYQYAKGFTSMPGFLHPIEAEFISAPYSSMNSTFPSSNGNAYSFYITGPATVQVTAVGEGA